LGHLFANAFDIREEFIGILQHISHELHWLIAANQGKHILVEKPLDVTVEGCEEIIKTAKKNNVLLQVDFHKRFDPDHGVRLVSFAVHWIRAEMHEFILRNWRIVKVATTKAQRKLFFNLRKSKKRLGWLSHEEVNAVAGDLGVKPEAVLEMESRYRVRRWF
jgi:hypothetical protein